MEDRFSDEVMCWLCDYWWITAIIILVAIAGYFTFPYWGQLLGF